MIDVTAERLYEMDDELIAKYSKRAKAEGSKEFALYYAGAHYQFSHNNIGMDVVEDVDYYRVEATIWNYTLEQARENNFRPLGNKLREEARLFFGTCEEDGEELAESLINLARSIS